MQTLFLDVDETILIQEDHPRATNQAEVQFAMGEQRKHFRPVELFWDQEIINALQRINEHTEIVWLTGWKRNAQEILSPLFNLPHTIWLNWDTSFLEEGKQIALLEHLREHPAKKVVWTDDFITPEIVRTEPWNSFNHLAVQPSSPEGLTLENILVIEKFLQ